MSVLDLDITKKECTFCHTEQIKQRIIRSNDHCTTIVPKHWFRQRCALVIPRRHIERIEEMIEDECIAIMLEIGRLSASLDLGYGSGLMQKYQPTQMENGIKMSHLHFHVFGRDKDEPVLFPVPEPNDFTGLVLTSKDKIDQLVKELR